MNTNHFFDETREQSIIKAKIVHKYFWAWAKVILSTIKTSDRRIAYIDLFSGPGRYKDGTKSTPILILEKAIADQEMRNCLVTIFNDRDSNNTNSLRKAVEELPGINQLKYPPSIYSTEVGAEIAKMFNKIRMVPTLFFVDPWGYKGLSLGLINSVLKNWGSDCIFFFNFNRINMGLNNEAVKVHMDSLFGAQRAEELRRHLLILRPADRELEIVEQLSQALMESGGGKRYVLPFGFKNDKGTRTSHHLIFVTKHFRGYEIMKEIMAGESTGSSQGVPSLVYNPGDRRQPTLFEYSRPIENLEQSLVEHFSGKTLTRKEIYEEHSVGRPFLDKNYRIALLNLEKQGMILVEPPFDKRRPGTLSEKAKISFPVRGTK